MSTATEEQRGTQIRRTVKVLDALLQGKRLSRHSAAALLGVLPAAADRQLREVRRLKGVQTREGETFFDKRLLFDPASFTAAVSACLMSGLGRLFRGTAYESGMQSAMQYLMDSNIKKLSYEHLHRKFVFAEQGGETSLPAASEALDDLVDALLNEKRIRLKYADFSGKETTFTCDPLTLVIYQHQLYVIVRKQKSSLRALRFSRIRWLRMLGARFKYPTGTQFDPSQVLSEVFGIFVGMERPMTDVVLKLHSRWRTYTETHRWHPTQTVTDSGKHLLLRLSLRPCFEFESWILGFGGDIEVVSPPALRRRIRKLAAAAVRRYEPRRKLTRRPPKRRRTQAGRTKRRSR